MSRTLTIVVIFSILTVGSMGAWFLLSLEVQAHVVAIQHIEEMIDGPKSSRRKEYIRGLKDQKIDVGELFEKVDKQVQELEVVTKDTKEEQGDLADRRTREIENFNRQHRDVAPALGGFTDAYRTMMRDPMNKSASIHRAAGFTPQQSALFAFLCPEGSCVFSYAFDNAEWSPWSSQTEVTLGNLKAGNHYFRVKAAKEFNGVEGIQLEEEDPSPAQRSWIVTFETPQLMIPFGPPIKLWRID